MKKRIISLALVAVMIVAMIPAMLIPTAAIGYYNGYDGATVGTGAIEVDGDATPDAAYLAGEKIINRLTYDNRNSSGETSSFEGYIAADDNGFYFWVAVVDQSLDKADHTKEVMNEETGDVTYLPKSGANDGDRVELYLRADSAAAQSLGAIGFDYLGQLHLNARYGKLDKNLITIATSTTDTGWVGELYVPWAALNDGFANLVTDNMTSFQMGIQCNNMTNDGTSSHRAYSYDSKAGGQYYRGMFSNHSWASGDNNTGFQGSLFVPVNFVGYKTAVVANALTVDGVKDAAYAKSEKIASAAIKGSVAEPFTAYTVATLDGLYVYADIIDSTLDKAADATVDAQDKFQLYFQFGNHLSNTNWGYIEMDYTTDDTTANFRYVNKASAWHGDAPVEANILRATTLTETGWTAELFIPWAGDAALDGLNELSKQSVSIMIQTNDGTSGIAYSNAYGGRAWYANNGGSGGASGNFWFAPLTFVFDEDVTPAVKNWAKYVDAITLDGVKDDKYDALAGGKVDHVYVQDPEAMGYPTKGMTHGEITMANVYYAFTDTDMYVFVEVFDNTVSSTKTYEYVSIYYSTDNYAGKFNLGANGEFGNPSCYEGISRTYTLLNGTNADTANLALTYVGTKENYTGYNVEFKMALDKADKEALAAGKAINVAVGVEINNANTAGTRIAYGYSAANGGSWWVSDIGKGYMCMPEIYLSKTYGVETECTHKWDDGVVTLAPTHTTEGVKTYTCALCEETKTETIAVLGEHNWDDGVVTLAPTHTAEGVKTYSCECGATKTEAIAKTPDHEWDNGKVTTEPTYTATGVKTYTCPCGATKTEDIPALEIPAESTKLVIESLTAKSGDQINLVVRLENNPGVWAVKFNLPIDTSVFEFVKASFADTILEDGSGMSAFNKNTNVYSFNRTSNELFDNISDDGVLVTITLKVKATALPADYTFSATIDSKNTINVEGGLVDVLAVNGVVTVECNFGEWTQYDADQHVRSCACGAKEYAAHGWGEGEVTLAPTHITEGVRTFTCECGEQKTEAIEKKPEHEWDGGKVTTEPTHLTEGVMTFTCICGQTRTEAIAKDPTHLFNTVAWEKFDGDKHVRTCPCGEKEYAAHDWDNGTVTLAPTYVAEGVMTYICTTCNEVRTEVINTLEITAESPKVVVDCETGVLGGTFDITISLENNPGIWAMAFELPIDTDMFEFVSADTDGSVFDQYGMCGFDENTNSYKFNGYNSDVESNITSNGKIVTITLKAKEDGVAGNYDFKVVLSEKNIIDAEGDRVLFAPIAGTAEILDYVLGDADGDQEITNRDVLQIFKYLFDSETYPLSIPEAADVDCDGEVTNRDVLQIFKYLFDSDTYPIVKK